MSNKIELWVVAVLVLFGIVFCTVQQQHHARCARISTVAGEYAATQYAAECG